MRTHIGWRRGGGLLPGAAYLLPRRGPHAGSAALPQGAGRRWAAARRAPEPMRAHSATRYRSTVCVLRGSCGAGVAEMCAVRVRSTFVRELKHARARAREQSARSKCSLVRSLTSL